MAAKLLCFITLQMLASIFEPSFGSSGGNSSSNNQNTTNSSTNNNATGRDISRNSSFSLGSFDRTHPIARSAGSYIESRQYGTNLNPSPDWNWLNDNSTTRFPTADMAVTDSAASSSRPISRSSSRSTHTVSIKVNQIFIACLWLAKICLPEFELVKYENQIVITNTAKMKQIMFKPRIR